MMTGFLATQGFKVSQLRVGLSLKRLVAISIDPEQSLTTQPISGRHSVASDGDGMYTSDTAPILRPQMFRLQKTLFQRTTALTRALGTPAITSLQAKRLDFLGLSHSKLVALYNQSQNGDDFSTELKRLGVNNKPLREKLMKTVPRSC